MKSAFPVKIAIAALIAASATPVSAQEKALNLYSARHYQTDEQLYSGFTKQTGSQLARHHSA